MAGAAESQVCAVEIVSSLEVSEDAGPGPKGRLKKLPGKRYRPTSCRTCMGSNGSYLPLAPLADRELSPQARRAAAPTRPTSCAARRRAARAGTSRGATGPSAVAAMSDLDVRSHRIPARNTTMSSMEPLDNVVVLRTVHTAVQKSCHPQPRSAYKEASCIERTFVQTYSLATNAWLRRPRADTQRVRGAGEGAQGEPHVEQSEKDAKLAQKLGQLQPFVAVFPPECMGQLASFGPT